MRTDSAAKRIWIRMLTLGAVVMGYGFLVSAVVQKRNAQQEAAIQQFRHYVRDLAWDQEGYVTSIFFAWENRARNDELQNLKELTRLRWLDLHGCAFTDAALSHVHGLTKLDCVMVVHEGELPKLTDIGLSHLRELSSLRRLVYVGARVTDVGLQHLEGLRRLESLVVECREATDQGLKSLGKLNRLEFLALINGPLMTGEGLVAIPEPSRLTGLYTEFVSDSGMRTLTRFSNLRELKIGGDGLTVDGLNNLNSLRSLEKLTIQNTSLDNRALETGVGGLTWLKELCISKCILSGDAFKHLGRLKNLEVLRVSAPGVGDRSTPDLDKFPKLRVLDLERTSITGASLPHLLRMRTLERLSVPFSVPLTPERRKELLDTLPKLGFLKSADGKFEFQGRMKKEKPPLPVFP